jgi:2'-5' RNA ligase
VADHRRRLDPSAGWGVPAHVTVVFPFLPPSRLSHSVFDRLDVALGSVAPFDCVLGETRWFGDQVLWLAPDPDEPFRQLTSAVWEAFPECPPYQGAHPDLVPHLTVGDRRGGATVDALRAAETAVATGLPIRAAIDAVLLIEGTQELASWRTVRGFTLS